MDEVANVQTQNPVCPACSASLYGADLELAEDAIGYNAPDLRTAARQVGQTGVRHLRMARDLAKALVCRASYGFHTVLCCSSCPMYFAQCGEFRCRELWPLEGVPKLWDELACPGCGVLGAAHMDSD